MASDEKDKGRSDEARDPNRAPGTGLGDEGDRSQNPDVNPDTEPDIESDEEEPITPADAGEPV